MSGNVGCRSVLSFAIDGGVLLSPGPSEPNWAIRVRWRRLVGLLNLSCLLSETTLITDTDICENANFLQSFKKSQAEGLYARLRRLVELDSLKS